MKAFQKIQRFLILQSACLYIAFSHATSFLPTPLDQQLESVHAVIRGEYLGSISKRSPEGDVLTELSFKLKSQVGLSPREVLNPNNFKVLMPGGTLDGIVYFVHGVPKFAPKEEAILFLAQGPYGLHIYNLGLGKYNIVKESGNILIRSNIFPAHSELGNITFQQLDGHLSKRFGHSFTDIELNYSLIPKISSVKSKRAPASGEAGRNVASNEIERDSFGYSWMLMLFLAILGIISTHLTRRRN